MSVRGFLRNLQRSAFRIAALPGDAYAALYIAFRLNRFYHAVGFSAPWQIRLVPSRLPVSRRLMRQPYVVSCSSIKWGGRPGGGEMRKGNGLGRGIIFDGDWDIEDKRDVETYLQGYIYSKAVFQIFRDGRDYKETEQFEEMLRFVNGGQASQWQARGCRSESDIKRYFDLMRDTFEAIRVDGYKTQEELGSHQWYDEIKVFVDRNGEIHKQQAAGHHRLAMAKILNVPAVPVLVLGVHRRWAIRVQREKGKDVITSIDEAMLDKQKALRPPANAELDGQGEQ